MANEVCLWFKGLAISSKDNTVLKFESHEDVAKFFAGRNSYTRTFRVRSEGYYADANMKVMFKRLNTSSPSVDVVISSDIHPYDEFGFYLKVRATPTMVKVSYDVGDTWVHDNNPEVYKGTASYEVFKEIFGGLLSDYYALILHFTLTLQESIAKSRG